MKGCTISLHVNNHCCTSYIWYALVISVAGKTAAAMEVKTQAAQERVAAQRIEAPRETSTETPLKTSIKDDIPCIEDPMVYQDEKYIIAYYSHSQEMGKMMLFARHGALTEKAQRDTKLFPISAAQKSEYLQLIFSESTAPKLTSSLDRKKVESALLWFMVKLQATLLGTVISFENQTKIDPHMEGPFITILTKLLEKEGVTEEKVTTLLLREAARFLTGMQEKLSWHEKQKKQGILFTNFYQTAQPLFVLYQRLYRMLPTDEAVVLRRNGISPEDIFCIIQKMHLP